MNRRLVALAATAALSSAAASALAEPVPPPQPPYPPPRLVHTPGLRCDWGVAQSVAGGALVLSTPPGPLTILLGDAKVLATDGTTASSLLAVRPGGRVRVYYMVADGARAREIDLLPPARPAR
jgi:hypothetical protein